MIQPPQIFFRTVRCLATDVVSLMSLALRSRAQLVAENLFLRRQLALYLERRVKPRRADDATRITLVALSRFIEWRRLLTSPGIPERPTAVRTESPDRHHLSASHRVTATRVLGGLHHEYRLEPVA